MQLCTISRRPLLPILALRQLLQHWHSPTMTDTSDRYDDTIGGITWHVNDEYFQKSLSAKQSS
jgi:hypothetical protein